MAREFESGTGPDLYAGTPPMEARQDISSIAPNHSEKFSLVHIDVSCAYFNAKARQSVLVRLPNDKSKTDAARNRTAEEEHVWHT